MAAQRLRYAASARVSVGSTPRRYQILHQKTPYPRTRKIRLSMRTNAYQARSSVRGFVTKPDDRQRAIQFLNYAEHDLASLLMQPELYNTSYFTDLAQWGNENFANYGYLDATQPIQGTAPNRGIPFGTKASLPKVGWEASMGLPINAWEQTATNPAVALVEQYDPLVVHAILQSVGLGMHSFDPRVINPFNPELICGASSSGPGVAVALAIYLFALGSDIGGSKRYPARYLALLTLKRSGFFALAMPRLLKGEPIDDLVAMQLQEEACKTAPAFGFHSTGAIARDPITLAIVHAILNNQDPWEFLAQMQQPFERELTVGVVTSLPFSQPNLYNPKEYQAISYMAQQLQQTEIPIRFKEVDTSPLHEIASQEEWARAFVLIFAPYIAAKMPGLNEQFPGKDLYSDVLGPFRHQFACIGDFTGQDVILEQVAKCQKLQVRFLEWMEHNGLDFMISTTVPHLHRHDALTPSAFSNSLYRAYTENPEKYLQQMIELATCSYMRELNGNFTFCNATASPALVAPIPTHFQGLIPCGMQIVGKPCTDDQVLHLFSQIYGRLGYSQMLKNFHTQALLSRLQPWLA